MKNIQVHAEVYDFAFDYCGNRTAHFIMWSVKGQFESFRTKRRQQVGYSGLLDDGVIRELSKIRTEYEWSAEQCVFNRSGSCATLLLLGKPK